jgi:hypothetical protein
MAVTLASVSETEVDGAPAGSVLTDPPPPILNLETGGDGDGAAAPSSSESADLHKQGERIKTLAAAEEEKTVEEWGLGKLADLLCRSSGEVSAVAAAGGQDVGVGATAIRRRARPCWSPFATVDA